MYRVLEIDSLFSVHSGSSCSELVVLLYSVVLSIFKTGSLGGKKKCEVILLRNEMKVEITKYCFYQTLSMR